MPKKQYPKTSNGSFSPYGTIRTDAFHQTSISTKSNSEDLRSKETDTSPFTSDSLKNDFSRKDLFKGIFTNNKFMKNIFSEKAFYFLLSGLVIFSAYGCTAADHRNNYYGGMGEFSSSSEYDDTWEKAVSNGSRDEKSVSSKRSSERNSFFDFSFLPGFPKSNRSEKRKIDEDPLPLELSFENRLCPIDQVDLNRSYDDSKAVSRPNPLVFTRDDEISRPSLSQDLQNIRNNIVTGNSITAENNAAFPSNRPEIPNYSSAMENRTISDHSMPLASSPVFTSSNIEIQNLRSRTSEFSSSINSGITADTSNREIVPAGLTTVIPSDLPSENNPIGQTAVFDSVLSNPIRPVSAEKTVASEKEKSISWKEEAEKAIAHLQKEIEKRKGEGAPVSEQELRLRLLYLAVDEHEKAMRQWKDVPDSMNDFWACECRGLTAFLNGSENQNPAAKITQAVAHFEKGVEELKGAEPIKIVKCLSVESPAPFGLYKPAPSAVKTGSLIHIYAELENVVNRSEKDGEHLALQCCWMLIDEKGRKISPPRSQHCATRSASRLRDIVLNVSEEIPAKIKTGTYYLRLEAVDLQTDKPEPNNRCSVDIPITVASDNR